MNEHSSNPRSIRGSAVSGRGLLSIVVRCDEYKRLYSAVVLLGLT